MSLKTEESFRFHDYSIDRLRWVIYWREEPIALSRKSFDLLLYLIDHRDRVVSKDELIEKLWPDQFIEEGNLTQQIFLLRKALLREETSPKVIETVPGRGYRFTALLAESDVSAERLTLSGTESISRIVVEEEEDDLMPSSLLAEVSPVVSGAKRRGRFVLVAVAALGVLVIGGWFGWQHWLDHSGGAAVQVVLVPMEGTTGDGVLDRSLVQALRMDLAQSPYVSVVSSSSISATLTTMLHKPDESMTAATAREVCERTNSQAVLTGSIARAGQHFLLTEEAMNCVDGAILGQAKYDAAKPEELPKAMGKLAAALRQKLGESRRSIARFNMPLFDQNTASLDALKAFTQGTQEAIEGEIPESIALFKQSVAADPQFPAAYYNLAAAYGMAGDDLHTREFIDKAYALRDRAPKATYFAISAMYSSEYTGDMYELLRTHQSWVDLYPNSSQAWSGLANAQRNLVMYAETLASSLRTVQLLPHSQGMLANLAKDQMSNNDVQAARATCERAIANGLDGDGLRIRYLHVAYLLKDPALIAAQRTWAAAHPQAVGVRKVEVQIAMAEGRFKDAARLILQIREIHRQQGLFGADDEATKFAAADLMQSGEVEAGRELFRQSPVDIEDGQEVLGLVYAGDIAAAQSALRAVDTKYPRATINHLYWGPKTKAAIAMAEHRPAEAAALLETARPFDNLGRSIPWARGNAYLAAGQPAMAEKDFRSVVNHPEYDAVSPYLSLSWLGLAEALAAEGKRDDAITAYGHFFDLWAHADPDAVFLTRAKDEYQKLQRGLAQ